MNPSLIGKSFGKLIVIENLLLRPRNGNGFPFVKCKCECGKEKILRYTHLLSGRTKSCGCYKQKKFLKDMTNKVIGKLIVIKQIPNPNPNASSTEAMWLCKCECGNENYVCKGSHLRSGHVQSCGCHQKYQVSLRSKKEPFFWLYAILKRTAVKSKRELLLSFQDFLTFTQIHTCQYCNSPIEWLPYDQLKDGKKQSHSYHLDRKDNSQGYSLSNCVVCCSQCNYIKGKFLSYQEMLQLGPHLKSIYSARYTIPHSATLSPNLL